MEPIKPRSDENANELMQSFKKYVKAILVDTAHLAFFEIDEKGMIVFAEKELFFNLESFKTATVLATGSLKMKPVNSDNHCVIEPLKMFEFSSDKDLP